MVWGAAKDFVKDKANKYKEKAMDTACVASRIAVNGAKNKFLTAQKIADQTCPTQARDEMLKAAQDASNSYVAKKRKELNKSIDMFNRLKSIVAKFSDITNPAIDYLDKLDTEVKSVEKDSLKYTQHERTNRRKFLDESPQSGTTGLPGLRTYDDKVLLAFWITYGAAIISLMLVSFKFFPLTIKQKVSFMAISVLVAYAMAYYFIYKFA